MAKGNVRILTGNPAVRRWQTEANATAIYAGEPVKLKSSGSPYVIPLADAEPVIGTTTQMVGIAKSDSTQTASADGFIDVYMCDEGDILLAAKAKSAAAFDTVSEINALRGDRVLFDLTSGVYTIDQSAGDTATSGVLIVDGNPTTREVYFKIRTSALQGPIA